ncbi:MAG TPA: GspH/FimT family pseudopilin [Nonomuraea sp.]|nr:GspH/FimT family pseudopilin [Nonomuraea sp.]
MNAKHGLTLIELLVVIAVASVLFGFALPSVSGGIEAARAADARAALLSSLMTASNHAAIAGVRGVLCPSADGQQCDDSPDWSRGWIVFLDPNSSRELEGGERVLQVEPALAGRVRLRTSVGRTRIVFQGNGGNAGSNATFTLCDGRGPAKARALIMGNAGTLRDGAPTAASADATCAQ